MLVSACLLGRACRYDGAAAGAPAVRDFAVRARDPVVAVCPEELGGLGTPRPPADLRGGVGAAALDGRASVRRLGDDADVTEPFVRGARAALRMSLGPRVAVLKARSPSCGVGRTPIDGEVRAGDGVFAALLRRHGFVLHTEETLP